ncbi:hypothetical protein [Methanobrevibacter curvatus]|uniref:Uncharacterized protein n=1 Tax=Methanobrevibacter curvatus TaxID=49547 RepID=A0A166APR0_9EURY|nr:hypothetical protein [Methanobrevibacter curvatus]KZX12312.1 hypothetical protein MBCUR_10690 [Methanobrevibacter curvatus]
MVGATSATDITITNTTDGGLKTAIDTVGDNGTVYMKKGIYTGGNNTGINVNKNLTIIGKGKNTIIKALGNNQIFTVNINVSVSLTLINLTLENGKKIKSSAILSSASIGVINIEKLAMDYKMAKAEKIAGCSSIVSQYNKTSFSYGYRRDSTYGANIYLEKVKINGLNGIKEYKTVNGYFLHTLVLEGGWYIGTGGADIPSTNKKLENLGAKMAYNKKITKTGMLTAYNLVKSLKLGHFVIKSPTGEVGAICYFFGSYKNKMFKLKNGEYAIIPNNPKYFKVGKIKPNLKLADVAIYGLSHDAFGTNRRNIMTYSVEILLKKVNTKINTTKVTIYASNGDGKYVGKKSANLKDNIIYNGKSTSKNSLPTAPKKILIGKLEI